MTSNTYYLGLDVLSLAAAALVSLTKSNVSQFPEFLGECLLLVFCGRVGTHRIS
jgi:hypothetical protein